MGTKQEKIITVVSAALALILMAVVIACNVSSESKETATVSDTDATAQEAEQTTNEDDAIASLSTDNIISEEMNMAAAQEKETKKSNKKESATKKENATEATTEETTTEVAQSKYAGKFFAKVSEFLFVRAEANANAEVVGKLYVGAGGDIIEKGPVWTKIKSGEVEGYINNQYAYFEDEIEGHESEFANATATATVNQLRLRSAADANASVFALLEAGNQAVVLERGAEWTKIDLDGLTGYAATAYLSFTYEMGVGVTAAQEQAAYEAEQARIKAEEEVKAAAKKAEEDALAANIAGAQIVETVQTNPFNVTDEEAYLIACVVSAETGYDTYEGQIAVANVILNRYQSGIFGATITDIIFAKGQFTISDNGPMQQFMKKGPLDSAVQATKEAISGKNVVPGYYYFCTPGTAQYSRYSKYTQIGGAVFYNF